MASIKVTTHDDVIYFLSTTGPVPTNVQADYNEIQFEMDQNGYSIPMYRVYFLVNVDIQT